MRSSIRSVVIVTAILCFPFSVSAASTPSITVDGVRTLDGFQIAPFSCSSVLLTNPLIIEGRGSIGDDPIAPPWQTEDSRWLINILWADGYSITGVVPIFKKNSPTNEFTFVTDPHVFNGGLPSGVFKVRLYHGNPPSEVENDIGADAVYSVPICTDIPNAGVLNVYSSIQRPDGAAPFTTSFRHFVTSVKSYPKTFVGNDQGTPVLLTPGSYSISDDADPRFAPSYSESCSGTIAPGEIKNCDVTFPPVFAIITPKIHFENSKGGAKSIDDFSITFDGAPTTFDTPLVRDPGHHTFLVTPVFDNSAPLYEIKYDGACDQSGNMNLLLADEAECDIYIEDVDRIAPVIASHGNVTVEATAPQGTVVHYSLPQVTDNYDLNVSATCLPASGSAFTLGDTMVTCTSKDADDNAAEPVSFTVTVEDTSPPVVQVHGPTTLYRSVGGDLGDLNITSSDLGDGELDITLDTSAVDWNTPGSYPVTYTATDGNFGITVTLTVIITNEPSSDQADPVFTTEGFDPDPQIGAVGPSGAIVHYSLPQATDDSGSVNVICSPPSGSVFTVGTHTITCTAYDGSGHTTTTSFEIEVRDTTGPVITLNGSSTTGVLVGEVFDDSGASAIDSQDGTRTFGDNTYLYDDGTGPVATSSVNTNVAGTYTITYSSTDANGNTTTATRTVVVSKTKDIAVPVLTTPPAQFFEATGALTTPELLRATALDDTDGDVVVTASRTSFPVGKTLVTWSTQDAAGNATTTASEVTITDTAAPVITLTGNSTVYVSRGDAYTEQGAAASDIVDGTVSVTPEGTVDTGILGTTTIRYRATDSSGNTRVTLRTVVVIPATAVAPSGGGGTTNSGGGNGAPVGAISSGGGGGGSGTGIVPLVGKVLGASTGSTSVATTSVCTVLLKKPMGMGYKNDRKEVQKLQAYLNVTYKLDLPLTGFFGPLTKQAVERLQSDHAAEILTPVGLTVPSGYVAKSTLKWINAHYCGN